jgi:hypothetical protein
MFRASRAAIKWEELSWKQNIATLYVDLSSTLDLITTERAVECNLTLVQLGLIGVNEVTFIYTGMELIS